MSVAVGQEAVLLLESPNSNIPRTIDVKVLTSADDALLLVSPVAIPKQRVWLKRIARRFDRKFLECRVNNPGSFGSLYSLTIVGFAQWSMLTHQLQCPTSRPSTTLLAPAHHRQAEPSLMPLLSAVGLVVVYAANLTW